MKISKGYLWQFSREENLKSDRLEHSISVALNTLHRKQKYRDITEHNAPVMTD